VVPNSTSKGLDTSGLFLHIRSHSWHQRQTDLTVSILEWPGLRNPSDSKRQSYYIFFIFVLQEYNGANTELFVPAQYLLIIFVRISFVTFKSVDRSEIELFSLNQHCLYFTVKIKPLVCHESKQKRWLPRTPTWTDDHLQVTWIQMQATTCGLYWRHAVVSCRL